MPSRPGWSRRPAEDLRHRQPPQRVRLGQDARCQRDTGQLQRRREGHDHRDGDPRQCLRRLEPIHIGVSKQSTRHHPSAPNHPNGGGDLSGGTAPEGRRTARHATASRRWLRWRRSTWCPPTACQGHSRRRDSRLSGPSFVLDVRGSGRLGRRCWRRLRRSRGDPQASVPRQLLRCFP
jgi:hypothetical protein